MPAVRRLGRPWVRRIGVGVITLLAVGSAWFGLPWRRESPETLEAVQAAAAAGRWGEVEARLGRWIEAHPEDGQARLMYGMLLASRGRRDPAIEALRGVPEADPARARAAAMIGELELLSHRAPEAERALREATERDPRAIEPRQKLVYLLSLEQRTGEARDVLWQMYRAGRDPRILIDLVLQLWAVENDTRSLGPELEAYLAQSPDAPFLRRARGLALLSRGRAAEAIPHLEAAAEALVDDPVGRFALAECRLALGDRRVDAAILGPRPESPADAARWSILRARILDALGQPDDALENLRAAVQTDPGGIEARYRLGQALIRRGDTEEGHRFLEQAERLERAEDRVRKEFETVRRSGFESDPDLFERLGHLCREIGLNSEAHAWFELAVSVDPSRSSARSALVDLGEAATSSPRPLSRPRLAPRPSPESRTAAARPVTQPGPTRHVVLEDISDRAGIAYRYDCAARGDMFLADTMGGGVGLIDHDGDGWLDLYFVNGCPLPYDPSATGTNRLYRNRGDGTFEDETDRAGVAGRGYGMGCAVGDFDNDGHDDLFVTGLGRTVLYRNRGDGTFEDVTDRAGVGTDRWTTAAGFGDLDGDGDLDLAVVTYVAADPLGAPGCRDHTGRPIHCSPLRFEAQADLLFRNEGDGTFTDISRESGIDAAPDGRGLGMAIADLDGDGRLDIYVANDLSHDFLFINQGELRFVEQGMASGVACNGAGQATSSMGVVAEDLDGDGIADLFITNLMNESNTLFHNLGGGLFADATLSASLRAPSLAVTGFGVAAPDLDNDGTLDLFIANGHVDDQPWINSPMAQPPQVLLGRGGGRFEPVDTSGAPYLARRVVGRGVAAGDLDNDGRVDLVVVHRDAPAAILRNVTPGGHWLGLRLVGTTSGRTPVGARVICRADGQTQVRHLTSGTSYLAAHDQRLWFGLGAASHIQSLQVRWPSGLEQEWSDLPVDRILELREGEEPVESDPGGDQRID